MAILHGSWLKKSQHSYFFIWAEAWRNLSDYSPLDSLIYSHPFTLNQSELIEYLQSKKLYLTVNKFSSWQTEIITLPSQTISKQKINIPLLSSQFNPEHTTNLKDSYFLQDWQVEGFCISASETIQLLTKLPLVLSDNTDSYLGEDIRFWTHIYRWSLDLITRNKFLPGIRSLENKTYQSKWYPLLDSTLDQARFAKFIQLMPTACIAYQQIDKFKFDQETSFLEKQQLILDFLEYILDGKIRSLSGAKNSITQTSLIQNWLQSLTKISSNFTASETEIKRLDNALKNWSLSIQEYIITPDKKNLGINQFRVCFQLQPPTEQEKNTGKDNWKLKYYLQALDESDFLVEAETIWQNPIEQLFWKGRTLNNGQEILLKGLGLASRLYFMIAESLEKSCPTYCELNPIQVYEFIRSIGSILEDNGLGVILPSSLAKGVEEKRLGVSIEAKLEAKKGERLSLKSLLNYQLKVAIGEQEISQKEFEKLLEQRSPIVEINGEWIALQPSDVKAAQKILAKSYDPIILSVEDALRLSMGDNQIIEKLPVVNFKTSGVLEELINNLSNNQSIQPITHIANFQGELRPYQQRGVGWLAFLEKWGLGACLADDMGLGKTPQMIGFLLTLKEEEMLTKPTLIICPTSVLNNWEREVKKFAPSLSTFIHHGEKRAKGKAFIKEINKKDLVITSYSLVYRDLKTLQEIQWQGIVLDEAQNIKNSQAKQSQAVRQLNTGFRVALTGTPVENRLSELWSILDFLNPEFLGTKQFFQRRFATPIEKYGDRDSLQILRSLVRPFILRRLKTDKDIIQDLPEKQEMNVFCGLSAEQGKLYQELVDHSLQQIEESEGIQRRGLILTLLLKLKQLCNHPSQFLKEKTLNSAQRSGKFLRLEEMLEEVLEEGDHALIFTQFSEWGKLMQPYLQKKFAQDVLFLYGGTRREQRQEMIDRFQNDPNGPRIFILSLKAGGTGLNLTRANHVFHIDRWWNPAVENQATDRAFRLGQTRNVQVHKFVCTGTLEERIHDMLESKKQLAEQTVDSGEQWLTELDTDQLRTLLLLDRDAIIDES
ncbi:DEAD/DEAH box helicase [Aphanothece sacrum]|uniref:Helicase, SNF2/RAD54 family protein n=1 Tax=Aphanothece sacrum FPU1 TaxID=1920663 RepID=A0A401IM47_APHSA|nr:DEAD/DEAH box helicase [Aphanothece sacrum]GBF82327.1 helicase, SNF2/RAD54 family protein [Aphanothece sacrum FPU1]GBF84227.1 Helicase, SNF2/RAD54 family [Aphanothece sacrum FPU3]